MQGASPSIDWRITTHVLGPELAIETMPRFECFSDSRISSSNLPFGVE